MFLLSNLLLIASLGISGLLCLWRVHGYARRAPSRVDCNGIPCVFGHRLKHDGPSADYRLRLDRGAALFAALDAPTLILLGGRGEGATQSEAACGATYLQRHHGLGRADLLLEDHSRFTLENLRQLRSLMANSGAELILISNRYHLARISSMAQGLGLAHRVCAAEPRLRVDPTYLVQSLRDAYLLHWYWVSRHWGRLSGNRTINRWVS